MPRISKLLLFILTLSIAFAILNLFGLNSHLYWFYWWYDVAMHFMAGIILGLLEYWLLFRPGSFFRIKYTNKFQIILWILLFALLIGIGWEIMEYVMGMTESHEGYILDTFNDLILDSSGAVISGMILLDREKENV